MNTVVYLKGPITQTNRLQTLKQENKRLKMHLQTVLLRKEEDDIENIIKNKLASVRSNKSIKKIKQNTSKHANEQIFNNGAHPMKKLYTDKSEEGNLFERESKEILALKKIIQPNQFLKQERNCSKQKTTRIMKLGTEFNEPSTSQALKTKRRIIYQKQNVQGKARLSMPKMQSDQNNNKVKHKIKLRNSVYLDE